MSNNPILKNEPLKLKFRSNLPSVPQNGALVLYPHTSRERCHVYLLDDIVEKKEIKKESLDRLAYVSFEQFYFSFTVRAPFLEGVNQYCDITYEISAAVKQDKNSVREIIVKNITDLSVPVTTVLDDNAMKLEGRYSCQDYQQLEVALLNKLKEQVRQIKCLDINIKQVSVERDIVSEKMIQNNVENELERARIMAERDRLNLRHEEAEVLRKESEIEKIRAENDAQIAEIRRKQEMDEKQHEIAKKLKELEAEKDYDIKHAEKVEAAAKIDEELRRKYNPEALASIDQRYEKYTDLVQENIDRKRENVSKDFDLQLKMVEAIKNSEMNEYDRDELLKNLFMNSSVSRISAQPSQGIEEKDTYEINNEEYNEEGQDIVS